MKGSSYFFPMCSVEGLETHKQAFLATAAVQSVISGGFCPALSVTWNSWTGRRAAQTLAPTLWVQSSQASGENNIRWVRQAQDFNLGSSTELEQVLWL